MKRRIVAPLAVLTASFLVSAIPPALAQVPDAPEATTVTEPTNGGWINELCAADHFDPQTGAVSCWGATQFVGTWTGHTVAYVQGHADLSTGNIRIDRIDETFVGVAPDGSSGTLQCLEHGFLDGKAKTLYIEADIIKGTGDWVGASGRFVFDGFMTGDATGWGGWHGQWTRPSKPPRSTSVSSTAG